MIDYTARIFELERQNEQNKLEHRLRQAKRENEQQTLNLCIGILVEQSKIHTSLMFGSLLEEFKK